MLNWQKLHGISCIFSVFLILPLAEMPAIALTRSADKTPQLVPTTQQKQRRDRTNQCAQLALSYYNIANTYQQLGDYTQAVQFRDRAERIINNLRENRENMGNLPAELLITPDSTLTLSELQSQPLNSDSSWQIIGGSTGQPLTPDGSVTILGGSAAHINDDQTVTLPGNSGNSGNFYCD